VEVISDESFGIVFPCEPYVLHSIIQGNDEALLVDEIHVSTEMIEENFFLVIREKRVQVLCERVHVYHVSLVSFIPVKTKIGGVLLRSEQNPSLKRFRRAARYGTVAV
jgi:hypothetical protein